MFTLFLTGAGLAASAGLNAYFPILVLALVDRTTNFINLPTPYDWLSSNLGLLIICLVLPLELVPDKIAKVDHISDFIHTAIRPGAAALVFMATISQNDDIPLLLGLVFGLAIGGAVHWLKASSRAGITKTSNGLANPVVSLAEDALSMIIATIAVFLPWGVLLVVPAGLWWLNRMYTRIRNGSSHIVSLFRPVIDAANRGDTDAEGSNEANVAVEITPDKES